MERQHSVPILLSAGGAQPLEYLTDGASGDGVSEAFIRDLVHQHPACLPIHEIDAMFSGAVSICTELNTPAGPIDVFMVTPSGLPVLVECKLWRNPEARREVVSQILDYAKELSRWSSDGLQSAVINRLKREGKPLLDIVRAAYPELDEQSFHDALSANLRRGRFLLLIVGDGIRRGVEAIAEYLQLHAGLHFSLGLVELPIYRMPNGDRLVVPRVLARTVLFTRNVVAVPENHIVVEPTGEGIAPGRWGEASILAKIQSSFSEAELKVARRIAEWMKGSGGRLRFGGGKKRGGSMGVNLTSKDGVKLYPILLWTDGSIAIPPNFQWRKRPFFDEMENRRELVRRLNEIDGVNIPNDDPNKRPLVRLSVLSSSSSNTEKFVDILDWIADRYRSS